LEKTLVLSGLYRWYQKYVFQDRIPEIETSFVDLNKFEEHYSEIFDSLRSSGYDGVEGFLELPSIQEKPRSLRKLLEKYGMKIPIAYANSLLHDSNVSERSIQTVLAMAEKSLDAGVKILDINPEPSAYKKTIEEISFEAKSLEILSQKLKEIDLQLSVHYHDEMMRSDAKELRYILNNTDPGLVKLTLDFHWAFRAGVDPIQLLQQYGSRTVAIHLRNSVNGIWREALCDGEVDYKWTSAILRAMDWKGLIVVELANEKGVRKDNTIEENHLISRQYVRDTFGA